MVDIVESWADEAALPSDKQPLCHCCVFSEPCGQQTAISRFWGNLPSSLTLTLFDLFFNIVIIIIIKVYKDFSHNLMKNEDGAFCSNLLFCFLLFFFDVGDKLFIICRKTSLPLKKKKFAWKKKQKIKGLWSVQLYVLLFQSRSQQFHINTKE